MSEIEGFILTGGKSSRMGTDKARLLLGTQSFPERIASALASVAWRVRFVGAQMEGSSRARPFVMDVHREWGALGGLHAALDACESEWAAVVACDLPFVSGELFVRLASLREKFEAVVPVQTDERVQPLCALYRKEPCLRRTEELIAAGERRPRVLLESVQTRRVAFSELADLPGAELFFTNVNTPEDYTRAKQAAGVE
ncbi:MAG: molybdenum cofactor guanylyltransferase [Pyrinomonadaceae bacterium]|nr:molybdenum cofactor guanylyltransferase [Pyrinomonadaceae bacterium]